MIALYNGDSKAPIWLLGKGRSCVTLLLNQDVWAGHCAEGDWFLPIQPSLSENVQQNCQRWDVWAKHGAEGDFILTIQPI